MMKMMKIIAKKGLFWAERALEVVTNTSTGCNGLSKASCPINLSLARVCVLRRPSLIYLARRSRRMKVAHGLFYVFCVFAL